MTVEPSTAGMVKAQPTVQGAAVPGKVGFVKNHGPQMSKKKELGIFSSIVSTVDKIFGILSWSMTPGGAPAL